MFDYIKETRLFKYHKKPIFQAKNIIIKITLFK